MDSSLEKVHKQSPQEPVYMSNRNARNQRNRKLDLLRFVPSTETAFNRERKPPEQLLLLNLRKALSLAGAALILYNLRQQLSHSRPWVGFSNKGSRDLFKGLTFFLAKKKALLHRKLPTVSPTSS